MAKDIKNIIIVLASSTPTAQNVDEACSIYIVLYSIY